jgi:hypothetical protein
VRIALRYSGSPQLGPSTTTRCQTPRPCETGRRRCRDC